MHEWALAESVVQAVLKERTRLGNPRITSVALAFGELQAVDGEAFTEGLSHYLLGCPFSADIFTIETEPVLFACTVCGRTWKFEDLPDCPDTVREAIHFIPESVSAYVACPSCGTGDFVIREGRGVTIKSIGFEEV